MGSIQTISAASDASALTLHRQNPSTTDDSSGPTGFYSNNMKGKPIPGRPWCTKCKKPNHTIETCWLLHGKPADWNLGQNGELMRRYLSQLPPPRCHSHENKWRYFKDFLARKRNHNLPLPLSPAMPRSKVITHLHSYLSKLARNPGLLTPGHPII